jgi:hypothetical protein
MLIPKIQEGGIFSLPMLLKKGKTINPAIKPAYTPVHRAQTANGCPKHTNERDRI